MSRLCLRTLQDIAALTLRLGVDGLVVGNTTLSRPGAVAQHQHGGEVAAVPPHLPTSAALVHATKSPASAAAALHLSIGCMVDQGSCAQC
jgi:dihydroorotate dehydrogenase